jgi:hypothetical protein
LTRKEIIIKDLSSWNEHLSTVENHVKIHKKVLFLILLNYLFAVFRLTVTRSGCK